ncbi:MAG: hypothetical protein AAFS10_06085, partial [Myxococcota bacterium]
GNFQLAGISGIVAEEIKLSSKPPPPDLSEEERAEYKRIVVTIDRLELDVELLSTVFGSPSANFAVNLGGGTITGDYAQVPYEPVQAPKAKTRPARNRRRTPARRPGAKPDDTKAKDDDKAKEEDKEEGEEEEGQQMGHQINVVLKEISVNDSSIRSVLSAMVGMNVTGTVDGEIKDLLLDKGGQVLDGKIDVTISRVALGPGVLPIETGLGKPEVKEAVRFGNLTLDATVKPSKLLLTSFKSTGPDIIIEANGNVTLARSIASSQAKLNIRVKPDGKFLQKNSLTAALDLSPKVRRARAGEWYGLLLSGAMRDLKPFPSSRVASGLEKIKPE